MSKISWKPGTMLNPVPAIMVSCGTIEKPNIVTIAWTGIVNTDPAMTYISLRPERYSYDLIKNSGEFIINLTTENLARATDYCGVKSGRNIDKFKELNLTPEKSFIVSAPCIKQSPVSIECKVKQVIPLGSHDMFLAEIMSVNIDEKYLDQNGKFDLEKCNLIAYSHGQYYKLGERIGKFGFSVEKKVK